MVRIDRRSLLMTATLGLGAYAVPGFALLDNVVLLGFTHSVASGEPASDSMLLWTRFVPTDDKPIHLIVEVSTTADFARIVAKGMAITGPWRDWTTKITVDGLTPGTRYFYRFIGPDGMGQTVMPAAALGWLDPGATERAKSYILAGIQAGKVGLPFNYDNWGGYPAERARFLRAAQGTAGRTIWDRTASPPGSNSPDTASARRAMRARSRPIPKWSPAGWWRAIPS